MDILGYDTIQIHYEFIRRETSLHLLLEQSGMVRPSITDRVMAKLGEALVRLGTRLKEQSYHKLSAEEASAPTFMIML